MKMTPQGTNKQIICWVKNAVEPDIIHYTTKVHGKKNVYRKQNHLFRQFSVYTYMAYVPT